jgi:hypothetical protein
MPHVDENRIDFDLLLYADVFVPRLKARMAQM